MRIESQFSPAVRPPMPSVARPPAAAASISDCFAGENLIYDMIRVAPNEEARRAVVDALSLMPTEALARVSQYGTRIEVYDRTQADLPLYAKHLQKPNLSGAYSPTANVIFFDQHNITPLVLLHEFFHALDRAVGDPSQSQDWQKACEQSRATRVCIRPYATHNSAEYFADNLAAHTIPDDKLPSLMGRDWKLGINTEGLGKDVFVKNHMNYSQGRQAKADPQAYAMAADFLSRLPSLGASAPRPALTPAEYREVKLAELREQKARQS